MRAIALSFVVVLAGCSTPTVDRPVRPVAPPVVTAAPLPPETTVPAAAEPTPVNLLTAPAPTQDGMDALGTFVLEYDAELNCLYHDEEDNNGEPGTGGRMVIVWPFGYTASFALGKVTIFDATGAPVASSGTEFQLAGGGGVFADRGEPGGCGAAGVWYANGGPMPPG